MTQREQIKDHLTDGKAITPIEALNLYGCFRLAAIIFNLKVEGLDIKMDLIKRDGKRWAKYYIQQMTII